MFSKWIVVKICELEIDEYPNIEMTFHIGAHLKSITLINFHGMNSEMANVILATTPKCLQLRKY